MVHGQLQYLAYFIGNADNGMCATEDRVGKRSSDQRDGRNDGVGESPVNFVHNENTMSMQLNVRSWRMLPAATADVQGRQRLCWTLDVLHTRRPG